MKIAWLLEHQYSPDGLAFAALKSADLARTGVLLQAAERAECVAHLGIVHIEESGSAEPAYAPRRYRRWRSDDDAEEMKGADFEVVDICDSPRYVDHWRDAHDQPVGFGKIPLADNERLPAGALDGVPPDQQRLTEATGNEGASFERSYHRAAVVIWLRIHYADVLLQAGAGAVLPLLQQQLTPASRRALTSTECGVAAGLARRLVAGWPKPLEYSHLSEERAISPFDAQIAGPIGRRRIARGVHH
ncbi:MAG: hypothetical protein EXS36_15000 [Pedosphaera sp.]|nr:hypothetical protein [Pedosphaera sp.]